MNPQSMPAIKNTIRNLENKDCRLFTEELLQKSSTQDVMQAISQRYGKLMETDFA
jgi:phosphoenolpyruvate-protein kinase (PTS system EI component)